jgi:hypothetical protein
VFGGLLQERDCRITGKVGRSRGIGLWGLSSPAQNAALLAEAERISFLSSSDLKAATGFPFKKTDISFEILLVRKF